jgi:hypothetical protein
MAFVYSGEERILLEGPVYRLVEEASNSNAEESILWKDTLPILVLDNCSIHANLEIERVLEESGSLVRYLPPYLKEVETCKGCRSAALYKG